MTFEIRDLERWSISWFGYCRKRIRIGPKILSREILLEGLHLEGKSSKRKTATGTLVDPEYRRSRNVRTLS
jgi:hypothetical protein